MELQHLREFVALERVGNFTRAADTLYTTEATLSRHIKTLEKELGNQLFQRSTRRIELTEFGKKFMVYAEKIVQTVEECEANLLKKDTSMGERLMIGIFGPIAHYAVIQNAIMDFSSKNTDCTIGTVQGDLTQLKEKLLKREYNLSIVREGAAEIEDSFGRINLIKEPLCAVLPKDAQLSRGDTIDVTRLKGLSVTLPSEFMLSHRLFVSLCRDNGFEPKVHSLLKEREFIENFVSLWNGITILSQNMANRSVNPKTQVVKEISPPTYEYVNLLYLKEGKRSELTKNAIECFKAAL